MQYSPKYKDFLNLGRAYDEVKRLSELNLDASDLSELRYLIKLDLEQKDISDKYTVEDKQRLYDLRIKNLNEKEQDKLNYYLKLAEVSIVVMTGGRGSAKSHCSSNNNVKGMVNHNWKIINVRYTGVSAGDSIASEISKRIVECGFQNHFIEKINEVVAAWNKDIKIAFKGMKTGQKTQDANLKSLEGFNILDIDEAQEIPDFEDFEKVFFLNTSSRTCKTYIYSQIKSNH